MHLIRESFDVDSSCPSGLRWKWRPRSHFNSDQGWKTANRVNAGKPAGSLRSSKSAEPRYYVCVFYIRLQSSRIVYALTHNRDPHPLDIDHIDGDKLNNNPSNLRLATRQQNGWNRSNKSNNKSGYSGVFFWRNKWCARIVINKKQHYLGFFEDINDAIKARQEGELKFHGEFAKQRSRKHEANQPSIITP